MVMRTIAIVALVALAGCATTGREISSAQMTSMEKGKTTYAEVVARLGKPTMDVVTADGSRTTLYNFSKAGIKGATFVPIVGLFAGGMNVSGSSVTFSFTPDGVLKDYSTATTNFDTKNGAARKAGS